MNYETLFTIIFVMAVSNTVTWYLERKKFNKKIKHIERLYENALEIYKREGKQML